MFIHILFTHTETAPSIANSKFSPRLTTAYLAYISSLFVLFTHFFIQSYMGGGKKKGGKSKKN